MGLAASAGFVPSGWLATIVTTLERGDEPIPTVASSGLVLEHWPRPTLTEYRALFQRVGAPWLWFSRLVEADERLTLALADPQTRVFQVCTGGAVAGLLELVDLSPRSCELRYVGLAPEHAGRGHGRWLVAEALRLALAEGRTHALVKTCSLDHPAALPAYRSAGFAATAREVQIFPDPRLTGVLPRSSAPQVPLVTG